MRRHFCGATIMLRLMLDRRFATAAAAALLLALSAAAPNGALAQSEHDTRLADAAAVLEAFTSDEQSSIPTDLLARAHGIAVLPRMIRGGFFIGGRRGRGVITVKTPEGRWSNPAMITLTGGSIGWQFGAESADLVLVFANERSVRNIEEGKFTLGGDATAVAGPLGRQTTAALTGRAEVYAYTRSRGLFAGATFEGARLDVDEQGSERFYGADTRAQPFGEQNAATPASALRFLRTLERAATIPAPSSTQSTQDEPEEAQIFPLGGPP
jgi:lipid-binding SYLF domain-containing protein